MKKQGSFTEEAVKKMERQIEEILEKHSEKIKSLYLNLRQIVYISAASEVNETLWAKLPSYYVGEKFVRLIPFKDHINVEAKAIDRHKDELAGYKITPKGMLQIFENEEIPDSLLRKIFEETLGE